jgi:GMP synthase (glutamine-hydrolysing)
MILIINNHSKLLSSLENILKKHKTKFKIKDQRSPLSRLTSRDVSGIILGGGGPNLSKKINLDSIRGDILALTKFNVPVLGICEGHLMLAEFFGAEIRTLKRPNKNHSEKVKILRSEKIFKNLPEEITVYENHSRYVKTLPSDFLLTATSKKDRIESFSHKKKPIFGVQFHPEKSGPKGEKIITNFISICKLSK